MLRNTFIDPLDSPYDTIFNYMPSCQNENADDHAFINIINPSLNTESKHSINYNKSDNTYDLQCNGNDNKILIRQSKMRLDFNYGKSRMDIISGILIDKPYIGGDTLTSRMGIFEFADVNDYEVVQNGIYIQFKNGYMTLNYCVDKNVASVPYKNWNVDNFNSEISNKNSSGIKVSLSEFLNSQITMFILTSWNGPTAAMIGFIINGSMFPAHLFTFSNLPSSGFSMMHGSNSLQKTNIGSAINMKLPITYQIYATSPLKQSYYLKQLSSSSHILGGNYKIFGSNVSICPMLPASNYNLFINSKEQASDNQIAIMFRPSGGINGNGSKKIIKLTKMCISSILCKQKDLTLPPHLNVFKYKLQILTLSPNSQYQKGEIINENNDVIYPNDIKWSTSNNIDYYVPHGTHQDEPKTLCVSSKNDGHVLTSGYGAGIVNLDLHDKCNIISYENNLSQYDILVLTVGRVVMGTSFDTNLYTTADFIVV